MLIRKLPMATLASLTFSSSRMFFKEKSFLRLVIGQNFVENYVSVAWAVILALAKWSLLA